MRVYKYTDIAKIAENEITMKDGYIISLQECKKEWAKQNGIDLKESNCVAARNATTKPYYLFFTKEKVKISFEKGKIFGDRKVKRQFYELQDKLNYLGVSTFDLS